MICLLIECTGHFKSNILSPIIAIGIIPGWVLISPEDLIIAYNSTHKMKLQIFIDTTRLDHFVFHHAVEVYIMFHNDL